MIVYPAGLPHPLKGDASFAPENNILRTPMQSGRARQRQLYTRVPTFYSAAWVLTDAQGRLLTAWADQVAKADWFQMPLRSDLGLNVETVRFVATIAGPVRVGVKLWRYTADIEVQYKPALAPGWAEILPDWTLESEIFDLAMNMEWPAA